MVVAFRGNELRSDQDSYHMMRIVGLVSSSAWAAGCGGAAHCRLQGGLDFPFSLFDDESEKTQVRLAWKLVLVHAKSKFESMADR